MKLLSAADHHISRPLSLCFHNTEKSAKPKYGNKNLRMERAQSGKNMANRFDALMRIHGDISVKCHENSSSYLHFK